METELDCALCGAPEELRPLLQARFDGKVVHFCPGCMPSLIHGLPPEALAERLRQRAQAEG